MKDKAVILLSGGLDSAVTLFYAVKKGYDCYCLSFDYGQRHCAELEQARRIANAAEAEFRLVKLDMSWGGSALIDEAIGLPVGRSPEEIKRGGVPVTYVPARNTVFLSIAASFAEAIAADRIFIGAHFEDSSGYPDCRKEYLEAFNRVVETGTKRGIEGDLRLEFPLIDKSKSEIIRLGHSLGVPFQFTRSCYAGSEKPCMECDSCVLRAKGFSEAGIADPLLDSILF
ncbi:MAG: 7-cyano-7-deazaguanine synthase QueC [Candidatus Omnitrophota bacterium]